MRAGADSDEVAEVLGFRVSKTVPEASGMRIGKKIRGGGPKKGDPGI